MLLRPFLPLLVFLLLVSSAEAAVSARYVRVDNPTSILMSWQEIEVLSGGRNVVAKHAEWLTGTCKGHPAALVDGNKDTAQRGPTFDTGNPQVLGPWIEVDLQMVLPVEQIRLYASRYAPGFREYEDKGHRVLTLLDDQRRVVWSAKWDCYDRKRFPQGIYEFAPEATEAASPMMGKAVVAGETLPVPMSWLLDVQPERRPPDAETRLQRFAARQSPASLQALADEFFRLLEPDVPELAGARALYAKGRYAEALEAWKQFWFARMARVNAHLAFDPASFNYRGEGEDLMAGIGVTISSNQVIARRFTPGCIFWVDAPAGDPVALREALAGTEQLGFVNKFGRGLIKSYRQNGDSRLIQRWSEIMDDWAMNYFADADASRYNVKNLFVMNQANHWGTMMEELADIAGERPELVRQIPAATLARVQLVCLEQYAPAYWRQARETVFNHNTSGLSRWGMTLPCIDEFRPATRLAREWRQHLERWMTLGTEPDGSMTEIGDEGHFSIPMVLGCDFKRLDETRPDWFTPGWKNRAWEYFDNLHKYIFRHPAPGGYNHRFDHRFYGERFTDLINKSYYRDAQKQENLLNRSAAIYAIPEVRRILDSVCRVSAGVPEVDAKAPYWVKNQRQTRIEAQAAALKILGTDRPGEPRIAADWMPYTGAYYFRSGWTAGNAFLAMLAKNSRGGSNNPTASYGLVYSADYGFPMMRAETFTIDGLPQNPLGRKMTYMPGTKTESLTYAERDPAPQRWHASANYAFGEAVFNGPYQRVGFNFEAGRLAEPNAGKLEIGEKCIDQIRTNRQVLQLRDSRLFIVTDTARFQNEAERAKSHAFGEALTLMLSTLAKEASQPFGPAQLAVNAEARTLATRNPDGPNVTLHQFAGVPMTYAVGREAKPDFREYEAELTSNAGIAAQPVSAAWQATGDTALVTLIASSPAKGESPIRSIEPMTRGAAVAGFHATLRNGGEIWYQAAAAPGEKLVCGPVGITGESLLVARAGPEAILTGIAIGATALEIDGRPVALATADFEFARRPDGKPEFTAIYRPIENIRFTPDRNVFSGTLAVEMKCATPGVEIRYTVDGTPPTRDSRLYTGPLTITQTTEFAARAYRLGQDGKPLPADDFEINGTRFTVPSYGWFYKQPLKPAVQVAEAKLAPGLVCEHLQGQWTKLYSQGHWMPASRTSVAEREMDLRQVKSNDYYGARFKGWLRVPEDGVYTFQAPAEYVLPDIAASYDLRVYVDGEEWYLTQWWHGHGTWSVPLAKGLHSFQVDFADARTMPWKKSDLWRYYPRPWVVYQGDPGPILLSGPGLDRQRIPREWLCREAK
jgi:hypothetical protein